MIDFEEEIQRFKPSLDVEAVEDAIVKSDLTDMTDIMMELIRERDGEENVNGYCGKEQADRQQLLQSGTGKGEDPGSVRRGPVPEKKPSFLQIPDRRQKPSGADLL